MLESLLARYGLSASRAATRAGVSGTAVRNWIDGQTPNLSNAFAIADIFDLADGKDLLSHWGYHEAAEGLVERHTHDPAVANGWRLDQLVAEQRRTNQLLGRLVHSLEPTYPIPGEEHDSTD